MIAPRPFGKDQSFVNNTLIKSAVMEMSIHPNENNILCRVNQLRRLSEPAFPPTETLVDIAVI